MVQERGWTCEDVSADRTGWAALRSGRLGQLGRPEHSDDPTPQEILHLAKNESVTHCSAGCAHGLLTLDSGAVIGFGDNRYFQLGLASKEPTKGPTPLSALEGIPITQAVCGGSHSLFLSRGGEVAAHPTIWLWGPQLVGS